VRKANLPALLVMVPATVPFMFTLTFGSGSLVSRLATVPLISIMLASCACSMVIAAERNRKNVSFLNVNDMNSFEEFEKCGGTLSREVADQASANEQQQRLNAEKQLMEKMSFGIVYLSGRQM
jgi:hypothetical protein